MTIWEGTDTWPLLFDGPSMNEPIKDVLVWFSWFKFVILAGWQVGIKVFLGLNCFCLLFPLSSLPFLTLLLTFSILKLVGAKCLFSDYFWEVLWTSDPVGIHLVGSAFIFIWELRILCLNLIIDCEKSWFGLSVECALSAAFWISYFHCCSKSCS